MKRRFENDICSGYLNDLWKYSNSTWTWMNGNSSINAVGVYGTQGKASPSNYPGGRYSSVFWIDSSDNLWIFGGLGLTDTPYYGE